MAATSSGSAARSLASVHLREVSFSHSTAVAVLSDVTLDVGPGIHGVVGPNGAGKSTLLDLVDATLAPTAGRVDVVADGPVRRVRQDASELVGPVVDLAQRWDGEAVSWRRRFGLDVDDLLDWSIRSPGRRMQWHVAAALAADPDLLVLDEPTNHLDARAREQFVDALASASTPLVLLVSHDRAVLDALTGDTLRVAGGDVRQWAGGWTEAKARWEADDHAARAAHDRARRTADRTRRLLAEARTSQRGIERGAAATRRRAGVRDHDSRSMAAKNHAADAVKSLGGLAGARSTDLRQAEQEVEDTAVARRRGAPVAVAGAPSRRDLLATVRRDEVRAGDHVVLHDVDLDLGPVDRVRVHGRNGAGKTTLLRAVLSAMDESVRARVGVLGQEEVVGPERRDLLLSGADRSRVLAVVDHLGVDPERVLHTDTLSPGEARKLVLADLVVRPRPLVVLDEPTNHLDIEAIDRLQEALVDYPGALLLVTHDQSLAAATTDTTWHVHDGGVEVSTRHSRRLVTDLG